MPAATIKIAYRGQYRPRDSSRWVTVCERASGSNCWHELLTATSIPRNADLRVIRVDDADKPRRST